MRQCWGGRQWVQEGGRFVHSLALLYDALQYPDSTKDLGFVNKELTCSESKCRDSLFLDL